MTAEEIKARLKEKNLRQADLVRRWKLPSCTVAALVNRKFKSDRLEKRLARTLGVKVAELRGDDGVIAQ